jgi:simple sugar transport system substrate-binding protein
MLRVLSMKHVALVGCLLAVCGALAACGSDSDSSSGSTASAASGSGGDAVKVNFVCGTPTAGTYYAPVEQGAKDAASELDVDLNYTGLGTTVTPAAMGQLVQAAINQKPDALVVCDYFAATENPLIRQALDQGIPVFNSDGGYADAEKAGVIAQVGQADEIAGQQAGEQMIDAGVTHPLCVNQSPGNPSTVARCTGFASAFRAKGIDTKILNLPQDQFINTTAQQAAMKGSLSADQSIDGLLVLGPESATAAVGAVEQSGRAGKVKVGTFDTSTEILKNVRNGSLQFAIWQQPYLHGYLPVVIAAAYVRHHKVSPIGTVYTGPRFITKDNVADVEEAVAAGVG